MKVFKNLEGKKFGRLTILFRHLQTLRSDGRKVWSWLAQCDCGKVILAKGGDLVSGRIRSGENLSTICKEFSIPLARLYSRLRYGWDLNRALTEPVRHNRRWHGESDG